MNSKVSIIVPLYNAENYMQKCIDSIISQTYQNLEIILVDDGSADQTLNMAREYKNCDRRVNVITQENSGPGNARNQGLKFASGDYICFLDSDDVLVDNAIESMLSYMNADTDMIQCRSKKIYPHGKDDLEFWENNEISLNSYEAMKDYLYSPLPIVRFAVWGKLIRRTAIGDLKFLSMSVSEDVVFNAYLIDKCRRIKYIPLVLHYNCIREGSLTHSELSESKLMNRIQCSERIWELIRHNKKYVDLQSRAGWSCISTYIDCACIISQHKKAYNVTIQDLCRRMDNIEVDKAILSHKQRFIYELFHISPSIVAALIECYYKMK